MTINTKFNEGDMVFTIDTSSLKVKSFEVGRIFTSTNEGKTSETIYPKGCTYTDIGYDERKCFTTETELLQHIKS